MSPAWSIPDTQDAMQKDTASGKHESAPKPRGYLLVRTSLLTKEANRLGDIGT
jgi:hypothetical protein